MQDRYSILPAISLNGVLHLDILTRSWTAEEFEQYVEALMDNMNPYPQKNSVLVMDNASAHHFDGLRGMLEARHVSLFSVWSLRDLTYFVGACGSYISLLTHQTSAL
jgi:hypothetical protein